jgi:para-aminobenzoate synthetase / 4-amino-4-deoxychorismate lyase
MFDADGSEAPGFTPRSRRYSWHNARVDDFRSPDPAQGVFETLLVIDGEPIELDAHLQRLAHSVRELYDAGLPAGARERVLADAAPLSTGRLRLTLTPGAHGEMTAETATAAVDPASIFPASERAIALRPVVIPGGLGCHKWADRSGLAELESGEGEDCLQLLLDVGDEVLEASRANVFAVEGDLVITPPADGRILPGVTRASAIEAIRSLGFTLREQALSVDGLIAAGEAFLTGAVRGVEPVRSIGDAELTAPGETTAAIAETLKRAWLTARTAGSVAAR